MKEAGVEEKLVPEDQSSDSKQDLIGFQSKSDLVYEKIREWILLGRLKPGEELEQDWLAQVMNVSRMPLRQALSKLEGNGLIRSRPHRSAIVAPLSLFDVEDTYAARLALEGMLAEKGAHHCENKHLTQMARLIEEQKVAVASQHLEKFVDLDRRFHAKLYEASGYQRSCQLMERLRDVSDRYVHFYAKYKSGAAQSIDEHQRILQCCHSQQASEARRFTEQHVERGFLTISELIEENPDRIS